MLRDGETLAAAACGEVAVARGRQAVSERDRTSWKQLCACWPFLPRAGHSGDAASSPRSKRGARTACLLEFGGRGPGSASRHSSGTDMPAACLHSPSPGDLPWSCEEGTRRKGPPRGTDDSGQGAPGNSGAGAGGRASLRGEAASNVGALQGIWPSQKTGTQCAGPGAPPGRGSQ